MGNAPDPRWYREEAERLRLKGYSLPKEDPLRERYIELAREYDNLADLFERHQRRA